MRRLSRAFAVVKGSSGKLQRRRFAGVIGVVLILLGVTAGPAVGATTLPVLWTAGGLSAGYDSAGQAARIASDASGNVAVVSGPSLARDLAVTSYTASGEFRWRSTISPSVGTFQGDWVAAAPNGDFLAVGHNVDSSGRPIQSTLVRFASDGTILWRVDPTVGFFPSVGRLAVDAAGNAYLAVSGRGTGMFLQKYSPSGALLWSQLDSTGGGYGVASSLALSPDETDVVLSGNIVGGATWIIAAYNATTGVRRWQVTAEGTARDVVVDATRVYVTGQSFTGAGTPALTYFLIVVAYDRATGARLWRTDKTPADGSYAMGLWMAKAPDGSLVVTGQASRGFLDWYTVALETTGAVRWEAVRDGGLNTDEIPRGLLVLADGTTVVTGRGGPNLPGGYIQGVTAGYSSNGELLWEAFSRMETVWATALPSGDVCATGGYDALITCWQVPGAAINQPVITATPASGTVPLTVNFTSSATSDPNTLISSYTVNYGDGASDQFILNFGDGAPSFNNSTSHTYTAAGTYIATVTVFYTNALSASAAVTITVNPAVSQVMRSTAINLSATLQWSRVNVTGKVVVMDGNGAAVPGAVVSITWTRPGSGTVTQTATTSSTGIARFSTSGGRGTYTLTVNNISKTGYSFDSANSVLSKSITK